MDRLIFLSGPMAGYTFELDRTEVSVGRESGNRLQLLGDRCISRKHAIIYKSGHQVMIEDLASKNGSLVNGHRLTAPTPLNNGDVLQMAYHVMRYEQVADTVIPIGHKNVDLVVTEQPSRFDFGWVVTILALALLGPLLFVTMRLKSGQMPPFAFCLGGVAVAVMGLVRLIRANGGKPQPAEPALIQTLFGGLITVACAIWCRAMG